MRNGIRFALLAGLVAGLLSVPAGEAAAAGCDKSGYTTLDQSKYIRLQKGPIPKTDSTSDFGYYACRFKTGKRYTLGGNECFGNDLGAVGDYAFAGNYIAYEARTCGDPEGESDVVRLNVSSGAKSSFSAEQEPLAGSVVDYSVTDIVVKGNGNVAWIALAKQLSGGSAQRFDVRRLIGSTADRVDFGTGIVGDSLALSATTIYWLNGAAPKSASLP
jgi:hypothetical protein